MHDRFPPWGVHLGDQTLSTVQTPVQPAQPAQISGTKKFFFVVASFLLAIVMLLVMGEVTLRVFALFSKSYRSSPFRRYDPVLGIALIPNKNVIHERGCFQGQIHVNQWGMRDRDRQLAKAPGEFRIALVGDSLVEGPQVKADEVMNIRMEKLLAAKGYKNVSVLNFGVEGIGTTQEYLMYQEQIRQFHPDLVILAFVANDVMNNSSTLQPKCYGIHTWYCPYYNLGANGDLVLQPVQTRYFNGLRSYLEEHSLLTYYVERSWARYVNYTPITWDGIYLAWQVYSNQSTPEWDTAWLVSEKVLEKYKNDVERDGGKLVILAPPQLYETDRDWSTYFPREEGKIPSTFNPNVYNTRLAQIAKQSGVPLESLTPYFQSYRDAHNLQSPYFSLPCDHHYSPLGHEVAAEAMVQKLEEGKWLPALSAGQ
jgi:lysophospholipase L1-like esterase